jgi:succinate dehydrogenase/fumarate reductase-like Fe-S protein
MPDESKMIKVEIDRFDPDTGQKTSVNSYKVPFIEDLSVLDVLEYIYENIDPSVGFYASCRRGVCTRCVIKINGKARLACAEPVKGDLKLGPAKADKVIRDLKIDDL